MRKNDNSMAPRVARRSGPRLLLHLGPGVREAVDPGDIFFVEAAGDDTRVRTSGARAVQDVRPIAEMARLLAPYGFVRVHRNHLVNPAAVRLVRRRERGGDWEVRLAAPVNAVLPVSRSALRDLWGAFGE